MAKFNKEELHQRAALAAMQSLIAKVIGDAKDPVRINEPGDERNIKIRREVGSNADWVAIESKRYADKLIEILKNDQAEFDTIRKADENDVPTPKSLIDK